MRMSSSTEQHKFTQQPETLQLEYENTPGIKKKPFKPRKATVKPQQMRNRFNHYLASLEAEVNQSAAQRLPPPSARYQQCNLHNIEENEELVTDDESGFTADDEEGSSDDEEGLSGDEDGASIRDCDHVSLNSETYETQSEFNSDDSEENEPDISTAQPDTVLSEEDCYTDSSYASILDTSEDELGPERVDCADYLTEQELDALIKTETQVDGHTELRDFFQEYFSKARPPRADANLLLKGLKGLKYQKNCFDGLPNDVRSILNTPRTVTVAEMENGKYYHFGLLKGVMHHLSCTILEDTSIKILVNMDGIPLFKSSSITFWPILGKVKGMQHPFPIGVWCGPGKPSCANSYLRPFVDEAKQLKEDGIFHDGRLFEVTIWGISCDAPARSFVTGTRGHTARLACPKCKTSGVYFKKPGKVRGRETFPNSDAPLRTHQEFISRLPPDFHVLQTVVLEELGIDMVLDIPFDYMHLCCLGVMRKLLNHWFNRETVNHRITHEMVAEITRRLIELQCSIPYEFARRPRSMTDLPRWKATEFRLFLLYIGPTVLKGVLPQPLYDHFMLFHVAIKILSSPDTCRKYNSFSKALLHHFINDSQKLYGGHFITYNVHCLIHLSDDVKRFGPLDDFSCFPFENCLYQLKKLIKHSGNPLVQLVKRLIEMSNCSANLFPNQFVSTVNLAPIPSGSHFNGPLLADEDSLFSVIQQFRYLNYRSWKLSVSPPNCYVLIEDEVHSMLVTIENIVADNDGSLYLIGYPFHSRTFLFDSPCDSDKILSISSVGAPSAESSKWPIESIVNKVFLMPSLSYNSDEEEEDDPHFATYPLQMADKQL